MHDAVIPSPPPTSGKLANGDLFMQLENQLWWSFSLTLLGNVVNNWVVPAAYPLNTIMTACPPSHGTILYSFNDARPNRFPITPPA